MVCIYMPIGRKTVIKMFTKKDIQKFKEIALKDYGVKLSDKQALDQATATITAFESIIKDVVNKKNKNLDKQ